MKSSRTFSRAAAALAGAGIAALVAAVPAAQATDSPTPAPLQWTADQDHQNMMDQLGIKSLRPGAEGFNRQAPNFQNTDETKANRVRICRIRSR